VILLGRRADLGVLTRARFAGLAAARWPVRFISANKTGKLVACNKLNRPPLRRRLGVFRFRLAAARWPVRFASASKTGKFIAGDKLKRPPLGRCQTSARRLNVFH
jgi:hypothetical protein